MKIFDITAKNLKLLMRSKTTMFVVLFGPLIIMLLVGFAFNNPSSSLLNIGYYTPSKSNLSDSFVNALKENKNFLVTEHSDAEKCKNLIEQGSMHVCMVFPENFSINNNKINEVVFYVDQSRANFVYAVLDTVSSRVDVTSNNLSFQMTNDLLGVISSSKKTNSDVLLKIIALKGSITNLSVKLDAMSSNLGKLNLSPAKVDTKDIYSSTATLETNLKSLLTKTESFVKDSRATVKALDALPSSSCDSNCSNLALDIDADLVQYLKDTNISINTSRKKLDSLVSVVDSLTKDIDAINLRLTNAKNATGGAVNDIGKLKKDLDGLKTSLDGIKSVIEKANAQITGLKVTSAESIVNPITTRVEPINAKANNLNFLFPYLVILIIVFISIMLSSTIIIIEKTSKAYFRNFTTPTKDITFIASVFFTSFVVVIVQLVFILILAYYFLKASILSNVFLTVVMIVGATTLFTLIGMIIGYLFKSQEAVTMASISLGSVFLFLSNLVLPLETMSVTVQQIARYNPYVIASELLKKLTLFNAQWGEVTKDFIILGVFIVVAFVLTLIVEKASKFQYIRRKPTTKLIKRDDLIDKYLRLHNGVTVKNEKELLAELEKMSDSSFQQYVDKKKNDFETWLLLNGNNEVAKAVGASRTRKDTIAALQKAAAASDEKADKKK